MTVINGFGLISDKPAIPEGPIVVESLRKNYVIISWKPPKDDGGAAITNYIVEKREAKEGEKWNLVSSSISGTSCRVPNLNESSGYYFRVSAQNQYGISESLEIPAVLMLKSPYGLYIYLFIIIYQMDVCFTVSNVIPSFHLA